ncbi:hypothetical protein VNI00_010966 [Paramarasmius palmivorus]|uniref:Cytochrome P450 n=1 Tax=Paramarasmius palmivorus TaxID=297713 RepID=A0AAW0CFX6_9AGAR
MDNLFLLVLFSFVVVTLTRHFVRSTNRSASYPPGPKPWPIIGNALDIPSTKAWEVYSSWCRSYGQDLVHVQVLGQHITIVNSREMARELFEKRSLIYSDRPYVPMIDLCVIKPFTLILVLNGHVRMGWLDNGFGSMAHTSPAFLPYGNTWRQHRRLFQEGFRDSDSVEEYLSVQFKKIQELLVNLLNDPDNFRTHIRTLTGAIIMGIVYGHEVTSSDDYFLDLAEKANETLLTVSMSSATIVNMFPFMRHLPGWLPGCGFQRMAREARGRISDIVEKPYSLVIDQMACSNAPGFKALELTPISELCGEDNEQELLTVKQVCAIAYAAGADTTVSLLATFILAMGAHPHVQKKAQENIDNLLGGSRLPTWEDRSQLQYIDAIMQECLRWRPVSPLGLFHAASTDDIVNGFLIPKGTAVSANIW